MSPAQLGDVPALPPVIAIDGPAGSGKSTVSRAVATRLGLDRLDTGAMYRAVAWAALDRGIDPGDRPSVATLARNLALVVGERVEADGVDITEAIRGPEVSGAVSVVAANPDVRAALVERQRRWVAERGGGVIEGRDIGSVVFPDADVKIFLTATVDERARRRPEEGADALTRRDRLDRTRAASPLGVAEGARVIDTTGRPVQDIVEEVVACL
jgi:cytidylate kinase